MPVIDDEVDVNGVDPEELIAQAEAAALGKPVQPDDDESVDDSQAASPSGDESEDGEPSGDSEATASGASDEAAGDDTASAGKSAKPGKPEAVPYGRFKEAIDDKNRLKVELEAARQQLASVKASPPVGVQPSGVPQAGAQTGAPQTASGNGAVDYLRQALDPLMQQYLAPVMAQVEAQEKEAFRSRHAGKIDDDVIELAATKFELAKRAGMVQRNPDGSPTLTPDDVLAAEVGRLFMRGVNVTHSKAAASRAAVAKVNAGAVTVTKGRGKTPAPKFNPYDMEPEQMLEWARKHNKSGFEPIE